MIRTGLLLALIAGLSVYAWRDWFKSLCGLIVLMAFLEHPDMPRSMFGIEGLNPWNALCFDIMLAWAASRGREGLRWDMPRHVNVLLLLYFGVVVVSFVRMIRDPTGLDAASTNALVNEALVNPLKFAIPGLLLFDGCRTRERFNLALVSLMALYVLLAVQVLRWVPFWVDAAELERRSRKILRTEVGYYRVDLSTMLAGASWALFSIAELPRQQGRRLLAVAIGLMVVGAQALTAGRAGYIAWVVVGLVLCCLRWRRYLFLTPLVVAAVLWFVPGTMHRLFPTESNDQILEDRAVDEITAGRALFWPLVIDKIGESPVVGYGRFAFIRTGISARIVDLGLEEAIGNPHSAYLELLLDSGWVGFILVMPFYLVVVFTAIRLFRDSRSTLFITTGGVASALVIAQLVASVSGQSFYPREGTVGMWCGIGLAFRMLIERNRAQARSREASRAATASEPVGPAPVSVWPRQARGEAASVFPRTQPVSRPSRREAIEDWLWAPRK